MAEGGSDTMTTDGREKVLEWTCKICAENDIITDAVGYCKNCDECLCGSCLQYHGRYNKIHKVLGIDEKTHWGISELTQDTGIQCPDHHGQTISIYCGLHDDSCCPVCAVFKHSESCKQSMSYIPQIAKGIRTDPEFKTSISNMDELLTCFSNFEKDMADVQEALYVTENACARSIEGFYNELFQHLKKLEEASLKELKRIHKEIDQINQGNKEMCEQAKQKLHDMKQQMQASISVNEPLLFVNMKNSQKFLTKYREVSASLGTQKQYTLTFQQNSVLVDIIQSANSLGDFVKVNYISPEKKQITKTVVTDLSTPAEKEGNVLGQDVEETVDEGVVKSIGKVGKSKIKTTTKVKDKRRFDDLLCDLENVKEVKPTKSAGVIMQRYTYYGDQWSPQNRKGKKRYNREFLLQFQSEPVAMLKPRGLTGFPDIILEKPTFNLDSSRHGISEYAPKDHVWPFLGIHDTFDTKGMGETIQPGPQGSTSGFARWGRGITNSDPYPYQLFQAKDNPTYTYELVYHTYRQCK